MEDRIRERDGELHRLRNRLADQSYQPTGSHTGISPFNDLHSKNASVLAIENASLSLTSATIENARERLKTLDHESARIDEALSRWKEELFAPSSTALRMNSPTDDGSQIGCPGNRLSTVYLTNSMKSTDIRQLRKLSLIRSMPLEVMTNDVGNILHNENSETAYQSQVTPQQASSTGDWCILKTKKSDDKQQPVTPLSAESPISQEGVISAAEILQSNRDSSRKTGEVLISSQTKAKKHSMSSGDAVMEALNLIHNGQEVADSKLDLSHLSRKTDENANAVQLLNENGEFNNGNDRSERSTEYTSSELVSGTTGSSGNLKVSEEDNTDFGETTDAKPTRKANERNQSLFSKSSSNKGDNSMKLKFEEVENEQLDGNDRLGHDNLVNKVDTSTESHLLQEWASYTSSESLIRGSIDNQSRIISEPDQISSQTPLNAGTSSNNLPIPSETFEQIRSEHKMLGRLFCDPSFPADESSLYYSRRPPCSIVWMRPPEIVSAMCRTDVLGIAPRKIHYPEFIADGTIRLGDLRQGELESA
ncbi:unnamed protein product [Rodentolepis nana]|uniref:Calpain catalytic domain-containing protein n=1 Tax=Rodentolepis nana TaxID=102285 RepID=A0A3P7S8M0_RODNA|nr:unnamed protein product [Rodentolepis nana]